MTWLPGGHSNWFSVSLEGSSFQLKFNQRASLLWDHFDDAVDQAVILLNQEWGDRPLYLAMSGGIDSELVANALFKNRIAFTPVILKIENYNNLESWFAEHWCYRHKIQPVILEYSMPMLLDAMAKFFPKSIQIKDPGQTPILIIYDWVTNQNGNCIYGAGDINLEDGKFYCNSLDFISNIVYPNRHPTSFFMYTAELALCYVSKFDISLTEQYNKLNFYNVYPRPKIDYIHSVTTNKEYLEQSGKLFYIHQYSKDFDRCHWYGTKEQIIQQLHP